MNDANFDDLIERILTPEYDNGKCNNCNAEVLIADAIPDHGHHDGWEMPPYTEYLCPVCNDGVLTDLFYASEHDIDSML